MRSHSGLMSKDRTQQREGSGKMKTVKRNTTGIMLAAMMLAVGGARAGSLTPTNAPAPTMHTLEEIYQQLLTAQQQVLSNQQTLAAMQQRLVASGTMQASSGDMVLIPAGGFVMGACTNVGQENISSAVPQHTVTVTAFYMDKNLVTSNLWRDVYTWATNQGYAFGTDWSGKGATHPVHSIDWFDCLAWCNARSQRDGFTACYTNANGTVYTNAADNSFGGGCNWAASGYRLPTEAEWEKAARGGVANRRFPWDDANTIQHARANYYAQPPSYAYDTSPTTGYHPTYATGSEPYTSPVGSFAPNGYGLYDMAGNVLEWCWDWYSSSYYSSSPSADPRGPSSGTFRVLRGGTWNYSTAYLRCAYRNGSEPGTSNYYSGFRCVRGL